MKEKIINYFNIEKESSSLEKIAEYLNKKNNNELKSLESTLIELECSGIIYKQENNEYINFPKKSELVQEKVQKDNKNRLFIFDHLNNTKLFLNKSYADGVFVGDSILTVRSKKDPKYQYLWNSPRIIKRNEMPILYECRVKNGIKKLSSIGIDNALNITFASKDLETIVDGERLLVNLSTEKVNGKYIGTIVKKVGHKNDPDIKTKQIIYAYNAEIDFPEDVMDEVKKVPTKVSNDEIEGRLDLRNEIIFTIDGADTKDMDDAVSLKINEKGNYVLGVHIADVSHYIKFGSKIFIDALKRGCSIYTVDTVVPMLSHILSNGICSLNEKSDRLTKSCIMEIDKNGNIIDYKICNSVINSRKKMTYESVNKILENNEIPEGYEEYTDILKTMQQLSQIFNKKRYDKGCIDFFSNELKIKQDENNNIISIKLSKQGTAEKVIENFMILANETIATHYKEYPFVYRIHEKPDEEKMLRVRKNMREMGIIVNFPNDMTNSKELQMFLEKFKNKPDYPLISNCILSGMKKAKYYNINYGHFGLASTNYTHFTSPIRRINDLTVQILIDKYANGFDINNERQKNELESILYDICLTASNTEKREALIERERNKIAIRDYLNDNKGQVYDAKVLLIDYGKVYLLLDNGITGFITSETLLHNRDYSYNRTKKEYTSKIEETIKAGSIIKVSLKERLQPFSPITFRVVSEYQHKKETSKVKKLKKIN